jgi:hypothetical protein
MLETPKEMITTTQPETAIVKVKKDHLFACNPFDVCGMLSYITQMKGRAEWTISSQVWSRKRDAEYADSQNQYLSFMCMPLKGERQGLRMCAPSAINNVSMIGMLSGMITGLRNKYKNTMRRRESTGAKTQKEQRPKRSTFTQSIVTKTELSSMQNTAGSVLVVEKKKSGFLPLTMSTMTGIPKEKKVFIQTVRSSTAGLYKTISQAITNFYVSTAILGRRATAEYVLTRTVQRLSRKRVQPSGWKRPLPYGVMI